MLPLLTEINEYYEQIKNLTDDELRGKTAEFKQRIQDHTAELIRQKVKILKKASGNEEFDRQQLMMNLIT
jgi:preprotein translocase subunit SecA